MNWRKSWSENCFEEFKYIPLRPISHNHPIDSLKSSQIDPRNLRELRFEITWIFRNKYHSLLSTLISQIYTASTSLSRELKSKMPPQKPSHCKRFYNEVNDNKLSRLINSLSLSAKFSDEILLNFVVFWFRIFSSDQNYAWTIRFKNNGRSRKCTAFTIIHL